VRGDVGEVARGSTTLEALRWKRALVLGDVDPHVIIMAMAWSHARPMEAPLQPLQVLLTRMRICWHVLAPPQPLAGAPEAVMLVPARTSPCSGAVTTW
jgi:hypothetical protein